MTPADPPARRVGSWAAPLALLATAPLVLLGYGTDIDVANVLRSGTRWLDTGAYAPSRPPGAPLFEAGVAVLDRLGGSVAVGLASLVAGLLAARALARLLEGTAAALAGWGALVLVANPWFVVAATSLCEQTWALALLLQGAVARRDGRRGWGAVLLGLAVGVRASSAVLALAWLVAEQAGPPPAAGRAGRWWGAVVGVTAVGAACYVPSWWAAGRGLAFLDAPIEYLGAWSHLGRSAVKHLVLVGPWAVPVLLLAVPAAARAVRRWSEEPVVRFAVLGLVASELLFLRYPLKPVHLVPVVALLALLLAHTGRRHLLVGLVVAQLAGAAVGVRVATPDVPDRATSARSELTLVAGPLRNDVRCRLADRRLGPWPDAADQREAGAAHRRAEHNFACQARAWRGDPEGPPPPARGRGRIDG